jgi:hypothetical protein
MGAMLVLRKNSCGLCGSIPWGAGGFLHDNSLNEEADKAREGRVPGYSGSLAAGSKKPRRGQSPRGHTAEAPGQTPGLRLGSLAACQALEKGVWAFLAQTLTS